MRRETKRLILWVGRLITLFIYAVFLAYAVIVGDRVRAPAPGRQPRG